MMTERYKSVFDIIGPIMVGPSSSHTAGTLQIGRMARLIFGGDPAELVVHYYDSFAHTHLGHGTDYAIVAGVLGMEPDDRRVPMAVRMARNLGIKIRFIEEKQHSPVGHPNTAWLELTNANHTLKVGLIGCSIGGGMIEVRRIRYNDVTFNTPGPLPIILLRDVEHSADVHIKLLNMVMALGPIMNQQSTIGKHAVIYSFTMKQPVKPAQLKKLHQAFPKLALLQVEE